MYEFDKPKGLKENVEKARKIESHLRLPTLPVGVKFFKESDSIPDIEYYDPDFGGTFCQFVTYSRSERCEPLRKNYLIKKDSITCPFAPGILGFEEWTGHLASGEHMEGVHFESAEAAKRAQASVPRIEGYYDVQAIMVGPLMDFMITPDVITFAAIPGMTNKIFDGQMWNSGNPKQITYYNMAGICAGGAVRAYRSNDLFLSFPCHGGRRIGMFTDSELFIALDNSFFDEWILGMEKSYVSGHAFPVGHMLRPNPPHPPHYKILEWPDKVVPLKQWLEENE